MLYYHVDDDLKKAQAIDGNLDRLLMNYFREPVDNYKDWVIIISLLIRQYW